MARRSTSISRRDFLRATAIAGSGLLAACVAPTTTPAPQSPAAAPATQAPALQTTPAPAAAGSGEIQLLLVDWNEPARAVYEDQVIPKFQEANPNVKVNLDFTDWGQLDPKVMTASAGGLAPDLFQADGVEFGLKYFDLKLIADQQPFFDATQGATEKLADFYEKSIAESGRAPSGPLIALPYLLDNRALVYRKDFFSEVGLDPAKPPATWDEFRQAAIKLTKRSGDKWDRSGWHANTGFACFQTFVQFLWENGGQVLNEAGDKVAFDSDQGIEALALWTNLTREDKVGPVENLENVGDLEPMVAGIQAMSLTGYGVLNNAKLYAPDVRPQLAVGIMGQKEKGHLWYANGYCMSNGQQKEAAWKLLQHLVLDDDNFLAYLQAMDTLPPRKSIVQKAQYLTPEHVTLIDGVMSAPASHTSPRVINIFEVLQRIDAAAEKAIFGKATPAEAMHTAAEEANQILNRPRQQAG